MKEKILIYYEKSMSNIFILILYLIVFFGIFGLGSYLLRFNPLMKFIGIVIIVMDLYYLLYYPIFKNKNK